jgi:hypothetical protein
MSAINDLLLVADAIEALAFKMPPPNVYTPQFVMIANTARNLAAQADAERREKLGLLPRDAVGTVGERS